MPSHRRSNATRPPSSRYASAGPSSLRERKRSTPPPLPRHALCRHRGPHIGTLREVQRCTEVRWRTGFGYFRWPGSRSGQDDQPCRCPMYALSVAACDRASRFPVSTGDSSAATWSPRGRRPSARSGPTVAAPRPSWKPRSRPCRSRSRSVPPTCGSQSMTGLIRSAQNHARSVFVSVSACHITADGAA
jgi:hypothetical protein